MAIQFATLALIHMEPRYFLGIELSIIVIAPFALLESRRHSGVERDKRPAPDGSRETENDEATSSEVAR